MTRVVKTDIIVRSTQPEKKLLQEEHAPLLESNVPRMENAFVSNQRSLETLLSNLPGMVFRCKFDPQRSMEFVSDGSFSLTGYTPGDLVENQKVSYTQLIHQQDREMIWNRVESAVKSNAPFNLTYRIINADGKVKWVEEYGQAVYDQDDKFSALEGVIFDVTDRNQSEQRILRQIQRFEALRNIDVAITSSSDLRIPVDVILKQVTHQLNLDAADIFLLNPRSQLLEYLSGRGFNTPMPQHAYYRMGDGITGLVAKNRELIFIRNLVEKRKTIGFFAPLEYEGFVSYIGLPLVAKGGIKGVLEVFHRSMLDPDEDRLEFLEMLAGQAAVAIHNATLFEDLQRTNIELVLAYDATLVGWANALELYDCEVEGHTQRVIEWTLKLSQSMGIKKDDLQHIRRGALLHDIGKMGIPDTILTKPGPLSPDEWETIRQHPVYAYQLLSPILFLRPALDIPYCHHEKWDGTGYPRQLKGEQIPLAARIYAVVDVWDALLSERPYRPAWSKGEAMQYIRDQAGKHFDPLVARKFLELLN